MESVQTVSKKPFSIQEIRAHLERFWKTDDSSREDSFVVHGSVGRVFVHAESLDAEYELLLDYSDFELVKAIIEKIANDSELVVDNDFESALRGDQFVARLKADRSWDWRKR